MWRGISLRKLGMLVFGPMLSETLVMLFAAWMVLYAERSQGYEPWQHMLIPMMGSIGYAASALIAGRWVTPAWAPRLMIATILVVAALGISAMALASYPGFLALGLLIGLTIGHYYTPFQINMTHVRPFRTLAWSVAFYNVAWGTGAAVGPFLGSSLRTATMPALIGLAVSLALAHTILALAARTAPPPRQEIIPTRVFNSTAAQRRVMLLAFVSINSIVRGLYITLWPNLGGRYGWSDAQVGLGQFCIFAPVPIAALLWARLRHRLDRPWIMLASMVVGVAGLAALPMMSHWAAAMACATAVGLMESCVVFHAIYYMNADPNPSSRSRSVGVFEMSAGLAAVLGPVCLGSLTWVAQRYETPWLPYMFGAAVVAAAIGYVLLATGRRPRA